MTDDPKDKTTILIAEDIAIQAKKLQFYLERFGYQVIWGQNGKEALQLFHEHPEIDLVITDIQMPEMDGLGLLENIRKTEKAPKVPVIVLTTLTEEDVCLQALKLGASEFLNKPFKPEETKLRCENLISLRKYEKILASENMVLLESLAEKNKALEKSYSDLNGAFAELKKTQAQLVQTSRLASIAKLGGGLAHEINSPLAAIQLSVDKIEEKIQGAQAAGEDIAKWNQRISSSTAKISNVIKHLRAFSKISDHKFDNSEVDLNEAINHLPHFYSELTKQNQIEVTTKQHPTPLKIWGNTIILEHIFLGLIYNSIEATQKASSKKILIVSKITDNSAVFEIADTGCGISPENLPKIFDPFFTTKEPGQGFGLGLSIGHSYTQELKGSLVCIQSTPKGTIFQVRFPLLKTEQEKLSG